MSARQQSYATNGRSHPLFWPVSISITAHLLLMVFLVWSPAWKSKPEYFPAVIDVQMVDLPDVGATPEEKKVKSEEKAPVKEEAPPESVSIPEAEKKPEVSVAPQKKKSKKALKYKSVKSKKVIKDVLKRVEKKVDTAPPKPLEDTIKRIREKVTKEGRPGPAADTSPKSDTVGKSGTYGRGSNQEVNQEELYRLDIAYAIKKNWAYAGLLSGRGDQLVASVTFKVMPDGEIKDVFFTERSGDQNLDNSAYRAIVKSSPVKPHPKSLSRDFVLVGLRFNPEGVQ